MQTLTWQSHVSREGKKQRVCCLLFPPKKSSFFSDTQVYEIRWPWPYRLKNCSRANFSYKAHYSPPNPAATTLNLNLPLFADKPDLWMVNRTKPSFCLKLQVFFFHLNKGNLKSQRDFSKKALQLFFKKNVGDNKGRLRIEVLLWGHFDLLTWEASGTLYQGAKKGRERMALERGREVSNSPGWPEMGSWGFHRLLIIEQMYSSMKRDLPWHVHPIIFTFFIIKGHQQALSPIPSRSLRSSPPTYIFIKLLLYQCLTFFTHILNFIFKILSGI